MHNSDAQQKQNGNGNGNGKNAHTVSPRYRYLGTF